PLIGGCFILSKFFNIKIYLWCQGIILKQKIHFYILQYTQKNSIVLNLKNFNFRKTLTLWKELIAEKLIKVL
ncbi:MAG: hypothetical protein N2Z73_01455, partial [Endomicrobia bacterium]|nr:hypothetical protein [Endomicrobiia bacterium]